MEDAEREAKMRTGLAGKKGSAKREMGECSVSGWFVGEEKGVN